jgi:hypothetical protein
MTDQSARLMHRISESGSNPSLSVILLTIKTALESR